MEFRTRPQQTTYEKTKSYLGELFGEMVRAQPNRPVFILPMGSTLTHIAITPWGDDDAVVLVRAYVVFGADLAPDLLKFLLQENDTKRFGAFGVDQDGDIFFEHSIVGSTCDKEELKASVLAVASTADLFDDQIVERWGGMRAMDRLKQSI
jgi:hypothetical protein